MEPKTEPPAAYSCGTGMDGDDEAESIFDLIGADRRVLLVPVDTYVPRGAELIELRGTTVQWAIRYDSALMERSTRFVLEREYRRLLIKVTPPNGIRIATPQ